MIDWQEIAHSSNIGKVGYDREAREMVVEFRNGGSYAYAGVDPTTAADLASASSPGQFFHLHVRNRYPTRRL